MPFTEKTLPLAVVLSDTCHGETFQYSERIVIRKHIPGNLLLQRVHT